MKKTMKLPIGIENFEKLRTNGFYYVDKTDLIKELLDNWGEVTLFTRPRRFGKSLNMNMLQYFFEYGCDSSLFDGLEISREQEYCDQYMGKFPVISITLKDVNARTYREAEGILCSVIGTEALRFRFLLESKNLSVEDKERYRLLIKVDKKGQREFSMSYEVLSKSLNTLSELLRKYYGQKAILLIDEYDVPLDKALQHGYYDEMVALVRSLLSQCLKSNSNLYFAVLTGCLRVAKESIFTGLNNLRVFSVTDRRFSQYFGFTDHEVCSLLQAYGLEEHCDTVREWYDGYRFGGTDIYCPWDVINYADLLRSEPDARPKAFWINTSGNDIIRKFIRQAGAAARMELERLISGETVTKKINHELTYRDLYQSIDNMWSVLFTTGYLTQKENSDMNSSGADRRLPPNVVRLAIPNLEIRQIFIEEIMEWFHKDVRRDTPRLDAFCAAFSKADAHAVEEQLNAYLARAISIRDTCVRKDLKENFYHGILLGLLSHREDWLVISNAESGEGYSDILVEIPEENTGIVIEVKYPDEGNLEKGCSEALGQIDRIGYDVRLREDGMEKIIKYGIACYKKSCRVWVE